MVAISSKPQYVNQCNETATMGSFYESVIFANFWQFLTSCILSKWTPLFSSNFPPSIFLPSGNCWGVTGNRGSTVDTDRWRARCKRRKLNYEQHSVLFDINITQLRIVIPWICYERSFSEFYLSIRNQLIFNQRLQMLVQSPQPYLLIFAWRN